MMKDPFIWIRALPKRERYSDGCQNEKKKEKKASRDVPILVIGEKFRRILPTFLPDDLRDYPDDFPSPFIPLQCRHSPGTIATANTMLHHPVTQLGIVSNEPYRAEHSGTAEEPRIP